MSSSRPFLFSCKIHQIKRINSISVLVFFESVPGTSTIGISQQTIEESRVDRQKVENIVKIIQFQSMRLLNLRAKVLIGHFIPACTVCHIWIQPLRDAILAYLGTPKISLELCNLAKQDSLTSDHRPFCFIIN